jgi:hypothetical protein
MPYIEINWLIESTSERIIFSNTHLYKTNYIVHLSTQEKKGMQVIEVIKLNILTRESCIKLEVCDAIISFHNRNKHHF